MTRPAPLTDPDADLTSFKDMPFEVVRFAKSDLVAFASAESVLAALMLWGSSWHSRPAGSLTNDDRSLMRAAGFGRGAEAAWHAVKDDALRGWIECSDGRLYHPVVAEKVATSWKARLKQKHTNYLTAIRMHNGRNPDDLRDKVSYDEWLRLGRPDEVRDIAPPRPVQSEMALPDPELRGKNDDVTDNGEAVTRNKDACSGEQAPQGKGREGKGREGTYINTLQQPLDSDLPPAAVATPKVDPFDLTATADRFARLAGIPHTQPGSIAQNVAMIREWNNDGIDLDAVLCPIIDRFRLDKPDQRISTLRFFDQSVRAAVSAAEAKRGKSGGYVAKPGKAVDPLRQRDADDDRVRQIRGALAEIVDLGKDRAALTLDGDTLIVTARSMFLKTKIRGEHWSALTTAADRVGLHDVEVRAQ